MYLFTASVQDFYLSEVTIKVKFRTLILLLISLAYLAALFGLGMLSCGWVPGWYLRITDLVLVFDSVQAVHLFERLDAVGLCDSNGLKKFRYLDRQHYDDRSVNFASRLLERSLRYDGRACFQLNGPVVSYQRAIGVFQRSASPESDCNFQFVVLAHGRLLTVVYRVTASSHRRRQDRLRPMAELVETRPSRSRNHRPAFACL